MTDLSDKVALVTGGSRGIGAGIVRHLADAGARVAFTYQSSPDAANALASSLGGPDKARAIQADSADTAAIERVVAETVEAFGRLDILVANAGIAVFDGATDISMEDLNRTIDVNIRGAYVAAREAARRMNGWGRIVTIGSVNADRVPFPGLSAYAMSKAALVGMAKGMARELGPRGITVNNVQPGPIDTDLNPAKGPMAETMRSFMAIDRHGTVEEIAAMVGYLVSDQAALVNGASLTIDGGFGA